MPPRSVSSASLEAWRQISPTSACGSPHPGGRSTRVPGRRRATASASEHFVNPRAMNREAIIFDRARMTAIEYDCRSEEHTSELQSQSNLGCRLLLEKKNAERYSWDRVDCRGARP